MLKSTPSIFPTELNKLRQPKTSRVCNRIKRNRIRLLVCAGFAFNIYSKTFSKQISQIILIISKHFIEITRRIWLCGCRYLTLVWNILSGWTGRTGLYDRSDRFGGTGLTGLVYRSDRSLPVLPMLYISVEHLIGDRTDVWH